MRSRCERSIVKRRRSNWLAVGQSVEPLQDAVVGKDDPHRHARLQAVDDEVVLLRLQRLGIRLADLEFDPDRLALVEPEHVQHARRRHGFKPEPAHALESFAQV